MKRTTSVLACLALAGWLTGSVRLEAKSPSPPETLDRKKIAQVKSAFLYNFTKFVRWSRQAFPDDKAPIRMGVIDRDPAEGTPDKAEPFERVLARTVRGKKVKGRAIVVVRFHYARDRAEAQRFRQTLGAEARILVGGAETRDNPALAELKRCHVIYVGSSLTEQVKAIVDPLGAAGILSVGETEAFARAGGMIGFLLDKGKIRFCINPEVVKKAKLDIDAKLLKLARIVKQPQISAKGGK